MFSESPPTISAYIENNRLYVDTLLYYDSDKEPLMLVHNELLNPPRTWDRNFDNSAIEIVDEKGIPRFQLIYKDDQTVMICGVFEFKDDPYRAVVVTDHNRDFFEGSKADRINIDPLFRYPSRLHKGEELPGVKR